MYNTADGADINQEDCLTLHNEICTYSEDLHNSVNQCLPNGQGMKCGSLEWVKDPFKAQDKPMPFSVT